MYAVRPRQIIPKEQALSILRQWVSESPVIYTSLINLNSHTHRYAYLMLIVIVDGVPINISYYTSLVTGLKGKFKAPTDFVQIPKGEDLGKTAVSRLQSALNKDVFMKVQLKQVWL